MRIRKKPWAKKELAENPYILRNSEQYALKFADYFNNDQPIHLELGCGKGHFIVATAKNNPQINHIAVEREPTVLAMAARLAKSEANTTAPLVFVELDAAKLCDYFNPHEVSRLYINFCDPWPRRKKWAKRRLTHANFLKIYETLQIPEIFFKTDNRILFEFSINQFSECGWIMRNISLDLHKSDYPDNIMTEYEEKFSPLGPIYRLEAYK
ncbi:MAG: tRNA (guanosine(46)-N7)-methyltransferase TrmB [Defluviitaleaceae bacterium]|nr:tRNA (guanosine(46)-N7)-methyltransferase TrmB [Defluviitaleaceae bacterium]